MSEQPSTCQSAAGPNDPPQPSLRTMFLVVVTICLVLGVGVQWGFLAGFLAALGAAVTWTRIYQRPWKETLALASIGLLAVPAMFPGLDAGPEARESFRKMGCTNRLKQIAIALQHYELEYGCYPPAYTVDAAGNRLHSWRTLILPYLEEENLYDSVDLTQPWDAAVNRSLRSYSPEVFRCPSHPEMVAGNFTSYLAVVGPETAWPGEQSRQVGEMRDGQSTTILVVEYAGSDIHWAEPRDLTLEEVITAYENGEATAIGCYHPGGAQVAFADGSVRFLKPERLDAELLRAMLTVDGEEPVRSD